MRLRRWSGCWRQLPRLSLLLIALCLSRVCWATVAPEPYSDEPLLRIDTGMHTATIRRMATDREGRFLVTASHDKTARVWGIGGSATNSASLLATLRVPIGPGPEGRLFAVAMSPDGARVAVGGWTGLSFDKTYRVYIFDWHSNQVIRVLSQLSGEVTQLAFSPNGQHLLVGMNRGGIRLFDLASGTLTGADEEYQGGCHGAQFRSDGRLVTSDNAGVIRLYDSTLHKLAQRTASGQGQPAAIHWSPNGDLIAVAYGDRARIDVLHAESLGTARVLPLRDVGTGTASVGWLGKRQLCTGVGPNLHGEHVIRCWSDSEAEAPQEISVGRHRVEDLVALPQGELAYATSEPVWGVLTDQLTTRCRMTSPTANLGRAADGLRIDADGRRIRLPWSSGERTDVTFSFVERAISFEPAQKAQPSNEQRAHPLLSNLGISGSDDLAKADVQKRLQQRFMLGEHEQLHTWATIPGPSGLLLGTDSRLGYYDERGVRLWATDMDGAVLAIRLTADARMAVLALADGTLRWYRVSDGRSVLSLFLYPEQRQWIAWTPNGYYACSAMGDRLIGWHFNQGADHGADFSDARQYRDLFHKPALVDPILYIPTDGGTPSTSENLPKPQQELREALRRRLPPIVRIVTPSNDSAFSQTSVELQVALQSPSGKPIVELLTRVNGHSTQSRRMLISDTDADSTSLRKLTIAVPPADSTVEIIPKTEFATGPSATLKLRWDTKRASVSDTASQETRLLGLAIGVSEYSVKELNLRYAAKDAEDFARAWKLQKGGLYSEVTIDTLLNQRVTRESVLGRLQQLASTAKVQDVVVVLLAGHGEVLPDTGEYVFVPSNADRTRVAETFVKGSELRQILAAIPGRVLLFLDTCRAGGVFGVTRGPSNVDDFLSTLIQEESGVIVFAAASGRQASQESSAWSNGAFTKSIVDGLNGAADYLEDGEITWNVLSDYIGRRVAELTNGVQTAAHQKPASIPTYVVAWAPKRKNAGNRERRGCPSVKRSPFAAAPVRPDTCPDAVLPLYRRWWLWTALGAAVTTITVGSTLGMVLSRPPPGEPSSELGTIPLQFRLR